MFRVVLAGLLLLGAGLPATAAGRVALVVGNSSYQYVGRLANPVNDAKLVAETLRRLGFKLVGDGPQIDVDKVAFDKAVEQFGNELAGADVGLFYYAGHGVEVRGANYLVPVGANPVKEVDADFQMLNASLVLRQMESAGTKLNVVILDACRNNPLSGRGLRSSTGGLAPMQAPEGTIISYATQPGNVAADGAGANSPYTSALATVIQKPGIDVTEAFMEIALSVKRSTGGRQLPWLAQSPIEGKFFFAGGAVAQAKTGAMAEIDPRAAEQAHWQSVLPLNSVAVVQSYLDRYPNGIFANAARARIRELQGSSQVSPPVYSAEAGGSSEPGKCLSYDVKQPFKTAVTVKLPAVWDKQEICWKDGTVIAVVRQTGGEGPNISDPAGNLAVSEVDGRRHSCRYNSICILKTPAATVRFRPEALVGLRHSRIYIESHPN